MLSQEIELSLIPNGILPVINVSENDVGSRNLIFHLKEQASGSVMIEGKFRNGIGFSESCTMSGETVTVTIKESMTACDGDTICNLYFKDGAQILRSANFIMKVQRRPK